MRNIRMNYLYRDAGNYKLFNHVVFRNVRRLSIEEVDSRLKRKLIDDQWMDPVEWKVPVLHFGIYDIEQDVPWYEYLSVEETDDDVDWELPWLL